MPSMMIGGMGTPLEFITARGRLYIVNSATGGLRRIYADGRQHPSADDIVPNRVGHSIARWEGETLIVDTVGLLAGAIDMQTCHSDMFHIIERFRLTDANTIRAEITLEDPQALAKPWSSVRVYRRSKLNEVVLPDDAAAPVTDRHF